MGKTQAKFSKNSDSRVPNTLYCLIESILKVSKRQTRGIVAFTLDVLCKRIFRESFAVLNLLLSRKICMQKMRKNGLLLSNCKPVCLQVSLPLKFCVYTFLGERQKEEKGELFVLWHGVHTSAQPCAVVCTPCQSTAQCSATAVGWQQRAKFCAFCECTVHTGQVSWRQLIILF